MNFDELREAILYHRIVEWNNNIIRLDNGMEISILETDSDCCAVASGEFADVVLDAVITNVSDIEYEPWEDKYDTYGCKATVTILHNQNIICRAMANADAGNGGYYYSVASFCVTFPNKQRKDCTFVESWYGRE